MRINIATLGTRGDVQPYLALARGLVARGHAVQIAGPEQFGEFVGSAGIDFAPLPGEFLALLDTPEGKAAVAGGKGFSAGFKLLKHVRPLMGRLLDAEWDAVRAFSPDLIIHHPKSIASPHMAERLGIPHILASPLPGFTPTAAFPSPLLPMANLGPFNRASHRLSIHGGELLFRKMLREWRFSTLGLGKRRAGSGPIATLYAYSPHVLPKPQDWDDSVGVTGYWFLDEGKGWTMPAGLGDFLDRGDPPIYVGFGSMPGVDPVRLGAVVVEALARAGRRAIVATGGGALEIGDVPSHVHVLSSAPHDVLFRHVGAALHHGGAGTTGASLRAGLPTIICPFMGDQPFWARRVAALGCGPPPLDRNRLDVAALAGAFAATGDAGMKDRAAILGRRIAAEDGVTAAVEHIERAAAGCGW
ncbi:MAG: glycosyltransferase [Sphingopyxis sp.]|uniref:glycosyltransferase n=1 Tax=Sphingopyxis sp. TaxID=1908224 RepID=UPI002ABC2AAB|nr:glycosyltransferase [Sphingopyxis sp.]MDZ3832922.1 glycosyltransferase [Sphingopyxis sp.]